MSPVVARALAGAAALAVVGLYLTGLDAPLSNYDEPIYAEFVRSMAADGDYLALRYQGAETLQRPVTSVVLMAGAAGVADGERGLRLAAALLTVLATLVAGWSTRRIFGGWAGAVVTTAVAAGTPSVFTYGRMALSDPPFVVAVVAAAIATARAQRDPRFVAWAAAFLGIAVSFKSLAAGVPAAALAPWLVRSWRCFGAGARPRRAVGLFLLFAAPYFVAGFAAHGARFWHEHIASMLVDRAMGDLEQVIGMGGPLSYVRHMWQIDGVAAVGLLLGGSAAAAVMAIRGRDPELGVVASAALGTLLLLSVLGTRLAHYLLVFYPLAAMAAGATVARVLPKAGARSAALGALAVAVAVGYFSQGIVREPADASALPCVPCRELGIAIAGDTAKGQDAPVYSLDWYAPALAYYARKPWHMLNSNPEVARMIGASDPFANAGNVAAVPPWPARPFIVAGLSERIAASGLIVDRVIGESGPLVAVVARAPAGGRAQ